jgi:hypothetical protein
MSSGSLDEANIPPPPREVAIRTLASDTQSLKVSGGSRAQFAHVSLPARIIEPIRTAPQQAPAIPVVGKRTYEVPRTRIIWVILGFLSFTVLILAFYFGYKYVSAWFVGLQNPPQAVTTSTIHSAPSPVGAPTPPAVVPSGADATGTTPAPSGDGPPTLHL